MKVEGEDEVLDVEASRSDVEQPEHHREEREEEEHQPREGASDLPVQPILVGGGLGEGPGQESGQSGQGVRSGSGRRLRAGGEGVQGCGRRRIRADADGDRRREVARSDLNEAAVVEGQGGEEHHAHDQVEPEGREVADPAAGHVFLSQKAGPEEQRSDAPEEPGVEGEDLAERFRDQLSEGDASILILLAAFVAETARQGGAAVQAPAAAGVLPGIWAVVHGVPLRFMPRLRRGDRGAAGASAWWRPGRAGAPPPRWIGVRRLSSGRGAECTRVRGGSGSPGALRLFQGIASDNLTIGRICVTDAPLYPHKVRSPTDRLFRYQWPTPEVQGACMAARREHVEPPTPIPGTASVRWTDALDGVAPDPVGALAESIGSGPTVSVIFTPSRCEKRVARACARLEIPVYLPLREGRRVEVGGPLQGAALSRLRVRVVERGEPTSAGRPHEDRPGHSGSPAGWTSGGASPDPPGACGAAGSRVRPGPVPGATSPGDGGSDDRGGGPDRRPANPPKPTSPGFERHHARSRRRGEHRRRRRRTGFRAHELSGGRSRPAVPGWVSRWTVARR